MTSDYFLASDIRVKPFLTLNTFSWNFVADIDDKIFEEEALSSAVAFPEGVNHIQIAVEAAKALTSGSRGWPVKSLSCATRDYRRGR